MNKSLSSSEEFFSSYKKGGEIPWHTLSTGYEIVFDPN